MRSTKTRKVHLSVLALLLGLTMIFTGCESLSETEPSPSEAANPRSSGNASNSASVEPAEVPNSGSFTTFYEYKDEDTNSAWDSGNSTAIVFDGSNAQVSGPGAYFSGGTLTINQTGTFVLSGTLTNGQVQIGRAHV